MYTTLLADALQKCTLTPMRKASLERGMAVIHNGQIRFVCGVKHTQGSGPSHSTCIVAYEDGAIDQFDTDLREPLQIIRVSEKA